MDFFQPSHLLKNLSEEQARAINIMGARDLGKRASVVLLSYLVLVSSMMIGSAEIRSYLHLTGPIAFFLLFASFCRFYLSKKLIKVCDDNVGNYLRGYGYWSFTGAFLLGLFTTVVIYQSGFSSAGLFMILALFAITSGAIGTFNLFSRAWVTFIMLLWTTVIIVSFYIGLQGETVGYLIAVCATFYAAAIISVGKRFADEYWRSQIGVVKLGYKMQELESVLKLVEAKEFEIRQHSDRLQQMVEDQTSDLRLAKEAAEKASQSKDEFLANMSHELRTPLHAIQSFSKLGLTKLETVPVEKLGGYFARIQTNGKRLIRLVDNLLDLSKLEASKMDFEFNQADLASLIDNCVREFEASLIEKNLKIIITPAAFDTYAVMDAFRIEQVIINFLSNAAKFSADKKAITLRIAEDSIAQGKRKTDQLSVPGVCFSVKDEGPGVPECELESVFDKFTQSSDTKSGAGGTGLGLAICKEIINQHDGRIWAENCADGGAEFSFSIPVAGPLRQRETEENNSVSIAPVDQTFRANQVEPS